MAPPVGMMHYAFCMVESAPLPPNTLRLPPDEARQLARSVLQAAGFDDADAELCAEVLVAADLRGVRSHGVARLGYFMVRIERGNLNVDPDMAWSSGSPTTAVSGRRQWNGIVASAKAMDRAIEMAESHGSGFVAVANSNHFGFAGYLGRTSDGSATASGSACRTAPDG